MTCLIYLHYSDGQLRNFSNDFLETCTHPSTRGFRNIDRFGRKLIVQFSRYDFSNMNSFEDFGPPWRTVALSIGRSAAPRLSRMRKSVVFNLSYLQRDATSYNFKCGVEVPDTSGVVQVNFYTI